MASVTSHLLKVTEVLEDKGTLNEFKISLVHCWLDQRPSIDLLKPVWLLVIKLVTNSTIRMYEIYHCY
jgi:hypothetical protein